MPFCSNCGAKLEEGAKFCPNCGAKIGAEGQAAPSKPNKVVVSFPMVGSLLAGGGVVISNGETYKCGKGENIVLPIEKSTDIVIKMKGFFGSANINVEPGDKVMVKVTGGGFVKAAKVDMLTWKQCEQRLVINAQALHLYNVDF